MVFADLAPRETMMPAAHAEIVSADGMMRPRIVVLCGSLRFIDEYDRAFGEESRLGRIVLVPGCTGPNRCTAGREHTASEKAFYDALHMRKIDVADEVFVINPDGYIGESTRREIEYAQRQHKPIRSLEPIVP